MKRVGLSMLVAVAPLFAQVALIDREPKADSAITKSAWRLAPEVRVTVSVHDRWRELHLMQRKIEHAIWPYFERPTAERNPTELLNTASTVLDWVVRDAKVNGAHSQLVCLDHLYLMQLLAEAYVGMLANTPVPKDLTSEWPKDLATMKQNYHFGGIRTEGACLGYMDYVPL